MGVLTRSDLELLKSGNTPEVRAEVLGKISGAFNAHDLSAPEKELAISIFRIMARDLETRVRQTLADTLKDNDDIPNDLAMALARDVEEVSIPILQFSKVIARDDLLELIALSGENQKIAIARREEVDPDVSDALVENGNGKVVSALVRNDGAGITEKTFGKVIDRFGHDQDVTSGVVHRESLPESVAERLVSIVSGELQVHLVTQHDISPILAESLILKTRQRALSGFRPRTGDRDLPDLVGKLYKSGRLTPDFVIRSIEIGDTAFFEQALSVRAGIPLQNARTLIVDDGDNGLRALFNKAGLPASEFMSVRFLVDLAYGYDDTTRSASHADAGVTPHTSWVTESEG